MCSRFAIDGLTEGSESGALMIWPWSIQKDYTSLIRVVFAKYILRITLNCPNKRKIGCYGYTVVRVNRLTNMGIDTDFVSFFREERVEAGQAF